MRRLSAESEQIGRIFAARHDLGLSDFRALTHIMVAESEGAALTAGQLRSRLGLSGAAVTYLVERLIDSGHITREADPADRRKVILRFAEHGMTVARAFFTPLAAHTHRELADLPDEDLAAAHRVFGALAGAMRAFEAEQEDPPKP